MLPRNIKRILVGVGMLLLSLCLLRGYMPRGTGITDHTYYFRDSGEYCLLGDPWDDLPVLCEERYFTDQEQRLVASGAIPGMDGLDDFYAYARYDGNEGLSVLRIQWSDPVNEDGTMPYIALTIWPEEPEESDLEGVFRIMQAQPEAVTKTEVLGMTVYGLGKPEWQLKHLGVVLPDGSMCSMVGNWVSMEEMTVVLDHFLLHGVTYSAFAIDKGDVYETISGTLHEDFLPYIPDYEAADMRRLDEDYYLAVNGTPRQTALSFGKQGFGVGWVIAFLPDDSLRKNDLGQKDDLTRETLEAALQEEAPYYFGFWVEDAYIYVTLSRRNLLDRVWMLIESL